MKMLFLSTTALISVTSITAQSRFPDDFVLIKGGTFTMGSPANESERQTDEAQHRVTEGDFYLDKYSVIQKEYREPIGTNPSENKGDNLLVENVTWFDAVRFCNARSARKDCRLHTQ